MNPLVKKIIWLTLFSIAMGYMESAVVIYLRKIYYPGGFAFPLIPIENAIAKTEFYREVATIVMLAGIGILTGRNTSQRFAFFIFSFAIWDISYYVFLKLLLNWPESLLTWDILFLIPVPWVGPVLAPCIISLTMILLTLIVIYYQEKKNVANFILREWIMLITGSLVVITSFVWDYVVYVSKGNYTKYIWTLQSNESLLSDVVAYIPSYYNWWMFSAGEIIILLAVADFVRRMNKLEDAPL